MQYYHTYYAYDSSMHLHAGDIFFFPQAANSQLKHKILQKKVNFLQYFLLVSLVRLKFYPSLTRPKFIHPWVLIRVVFLNDAVSVW